MSRSCKATGKKELLRKNMCCSCSQQGTSGQNQIPPARTTLYYCGIGIAALAVWWLVYSSTLPFARWITYKLFALGTDTPMGAALEFFVYDTGKILLLLVLMVYVIAWLRAALNVERVRAYLMGKGCGAGYFLGAVFGAITPFCSCSSIPLFLGFTVARIPVGITMSFLITSPLINEIAVVLLWGLLGWKFTVLYVLVGMIAGIFGGFIMDLIHAERWLQPFLLEAMQNPPEQFAVVHNGENRKMTFHERHTFAYGETCSIFRRVWLWVVIGVALGALLHGFVPQEWFAEHLGAGQWWSVPIAVAVGIPLYTNVTGIIPIMESLLLKGLPVGTTLAFCMSTVAVSLPEILMLKQVMQWKLLAAFISMLLGIFTLVGWFFNVLETPLFH